MNDLNWERLKVLKCAFDEKSISGAARMLGTSQPTVSRQLKILEREYGAKLFQTTPEGIVATKAGEELKPLLAEMEKIAQRLNHAKGDKSATNVVRISCGSWVASYLSRHIGFLVDDNPNLTIDIVSGASFLDLPRREADISICNRRPSSGNLISKRMGKIAFAVYGAKDYVSDRAEAYDERRFTSFAWAALGPDMDHFASSKWLHQNLTSAPIVRCSSPRNLLDVVCGGNALALLPSFVAASENALVRVSEPVHFDDDDGRIVFLEDARRNPSTSFVINQLIKLFERDNKLMRGLD